MVLQSICTPTAILHGRRAITTDEITALNWKVDGDKQEYADVAKEFLQAKGLIQ